MLPSAVVGSNKIHEVVTAVTLFHGTGNLDCDGVEFRL
ncbi:hypothetical protein CEV34_4147 [Brucella pseudogrignonensis]|uniref:Uncharacterized protein n=1 Tax=Brucella pseudogrignonensis TaxID=419475 RepID=A0A256G6J6_9HYPH|nr:hypothetical protein CEV34_4147 [Brucella pseudogrignonensis]